MPRSPSLVLVALALSVCAVYPAPAQEATTPSGSFRDRLADGSGGPEMMVIPAGSFRMGDLRGDGDPDERPARVVTIPRPFALGRYEVTFDEYARFCRAAGNPLPDDSGFGRGRHPVVNVTWAGAVAYTVWMSGQTARSYRLPSEAEWEYAARGGTTTSYWWGDEAGRSRANCGGCGSEWDGERTAPVGSFGPNPLGLFDMLGNLWEWTLDCYNNSYTGVLRDGRPHVYRGCGQKVVRGGSWVVPPREIRAANRWRTYPVGPSDEIGLRLARDLEP